MGNSIIINSEDITAGTGNDLFSQGCIYSFREGQGAPGDHAVQHFSGTVALSEIDAGIGNTTERYFSQRTDHLRFGEAHDSNVSGDGQLQRVTARKDVESIERIFNKQSKRFGSGPQETHEGTIIFLGRDVRFMIPAQKIGFCMAGIISKPDTLGGKPFCGKPGTEAIIIQIGMASFGIETKKHKRSEMPF